ncbi:NMD pathway component [Podochytrium sp. JEL0797]|nr:NMD pathway component [Podochytrium sp. JEL0797]
MQVTRTRRAAPPSPPAFKLVVRGLPPNLPCSVFETSLGEWRACLTWFSFVSGSPKHGVCGRAYVSFSDAQQMTLFAHFYSGWRFEDANGKEHVASVEVAPFQQIPRKTSKKDYRLNTLDTDPDFLAFLDQLANPPAPTETPSVAAAPPLSTPLLDDLRAKRQHQLDLAEKRRKDLAERKVQRRATDTPKDALRKAKEQALLARTAAKAEARKNKNAAQQPQKQPRERKKRERKDRPVLAAPQSSSSVVTPIPTLAVQPMAIQRKLPTTAAPAPSIKQPSPVVTPSVMNSVGKQPPAPQIQQPTNNSNANSNSKRPQKSNQQDRQSSNSSSTAQSWQPQPPKQPAAAAPIQQHQPSPQQQQQQQQQQLPNRGGRGGSRRGGRGGNRGGIQSVANPPPTTTTTSRPNSGPQWQSELQGQSQPQWQQQPPSAPATIQVQRKPKIAIPTTVPIQPPVPAAVSAPVAPPNQKWTEFQPQQPFQQQQKPTSSKPKPQRPPPQPLQPPQQKAQWTEFQPQQQQQQQQLQWAGQDYAQNPYQQHPAQANWQQQDYGSGSYQQQEYQLPASGYASAYAQQQTNPYAQNQNPYAGFDVFGGGGAVEYGQVGGGGDVYGGYGVGGAYGGVGMGGQQAVGGGGGRKYVGRNQQQPQQQQQSHDVGGSGSSAAAGAYVPKVTIKKRGP